MTRIPFDVVVFDFDGTLVLSAEVKRRAFFEIFPESHAPAVAVVLERDPEGSRQRVIPAMVAEAAAMGLDIVHLRAESLLSAYGDRVSAGVGASPAVPGAAEALKSVSEQASAYIVSTTPQQELQGHIDRRDWTKWVREAYGFPHRKPDVVKQLLNRHGCAPQRLLVVGDGETDEEAARVNGCVFLGAASGWPEKLMSYPSHD